MGFGLGDLCPELVQKVLSFLTLMDLIRFERVHKTAQRNAFNHWRRVKRVRMFATSWFSVENDRERITPSCILVMRENMQNAAVALWRRALNLESLTILSWCDTPCRYWHDTFMALAKLPPPPLEKLDIEVPELPSTDKNMVPLRYFLECAVGKSLKIFKLERRISPYYCSSADGFHLSGILRATPNLEKFVVLTCERHVDVGLLMDSLPTSIRGVKLKFALSRNYRLDSVSWELGKKILPNLRRLEFLGKENDKLEGLQKSLFCRGLGMEGNPWPALQHLSLAHYVVQDMNASWIFDCRLERLSLKVCCAAGDYGADLFFQGLLKGKIGASLKRLYLRGSCLDDWENFGYVIDYIGKFPNLKALDLGGALVGSQLAQLRNVLRGCPKLSYLRIGGTLHPEDFTEDSLELVALEAENLTVLDLTPGYFRFSEEGLLRFVNGIKHRNSLSTSRKKTVDVYCRGKFPFLREVTPEKKLELLEEYKASGVQLVLDYYYGRRQPTSPPRLVKPSIPALIG